MKKVILSLSVLFIFSSAFFAQNRGTELKELAKSHMASERFGEAIDLLNKYISQHPQEAEGYYLRGISYEKRLQYPYATLDLKRAVKLDPKNVTYKKALGIAILLLENKKEAGFDILEFLYEINIHEKTKDPIVIDIYLLFAQECEKREIYDAAAKAYKEIADIYDNNGEDEKRDIMYSKATECLKKTMKILLEIINERSEEEKYNEESNLY